MLITNIMKRLEYHKPVFFYTEKSYVGIFCGTYFRSTDEYSWSFNTEVTRQSSLWVSTGWVQLSAFAVCVLAWLFTGRQSIAALWQIENKYVLLGGVIGAFITITVIQSMGALGPAKAAMLIVISQLIVAYLIELLGIFGVAKEPFEWRKILGMLIAIVGIVIFKWQK